MFQATLAATATLAPGLRNALCAVPLGLAAAAGPPVQAATRHATMPLYTAAGIPAVCETGLARARRAVRDLEALPVAAASAQSVFHALNRMQIVIEDVEGPVYLLSNVSPDKAVRDAAEGCLLKYFPTEAAIAWVMHISSVLRGVEFRPVATSTWHSEVRYFDVGTRDAGP